MISVLEKDFYRLQTKTTEILVERQVFLSEQEIVDNFLDQVNALKVKNKSLISDYRCAIESAVAFMEIPHPIKDMIAISEGIKTLIGTTKRLTKSLLAGSTGYCFKEDIKEFKILLNDINEILVDINNRTEHDNEMADLLNSL